MLGIYLHIPFCKKKCPYCDFYSSPIGALSEADGKEKIRCYVQELCQEIESCDFTEDGRAADTIYFGGGTPSLLTPAEVSAILDSLKKKFRVQEDAEVTLECNPGTVDYEKLAGYRKAGVNRLSIGSQSFDDSVLKIIERIHTAAETEETVANAKKAGFENFSLDLMFGIPGQSYESFMDSVKKAVMLSPKHISFYSLEFMNGTRFTKALEEGHMKETSAEDDRRMYEDAIKLLEEYGFKQYEISNAAIPGFESRHNIKYWELEEYLGFGPSAASYIDHKRICDGEVYENTKLDDMSEYTFTGLRMNRGVNKAAFQRRFGIEFWDAFSESRDEFEEFVAEGLALETEDTIRLTLKGFNISNKIMSLFV